MAKDSLVNRRLNGFYIESLLGRGGVARVYRGIDIHLQRYVAIKVIDAAYRNDPNQARRFEQEARVIAQLGQHPSVVQVYHYGEDQGYLFMAMEYIQGADLGTILHSYRQEGQTMPADEILRLAWDVCSALDYIHSRGVIHRDLKPSNIMLDPQGRAILTDFGLALFTETGTLGEAFGSPHYIAPEQAVSSAQAVPQSDLYALGVMLFELFTGRLPFESDNPVTLAMMHMRQPPPSPRSFRADLSPAIEAVILKALSKSPQARQQSGRDLYVELESAVNDWTDRLGQPGTQAHLTLPGRVERELRPLPPPTLPQLSSPAATAQPSPFSGPNAVPPPPPPPPTQSGPIFIPVDSHRPRRSCLTRIILPAVLMLAAVALCVTAAAALGSLQGLEWIGNLNPPTPIGVIPTSMIPAATTAPLPSATSLPTDLPPPSPTAEPSPTPIGPSYELELIKISGTYLVIMNNGPEDFPLPPLQIGRGPDAIPGFAWGINDLEPGDCVVAMRLLKKPKLPDNLGCAVLGVIEGPPQVRLWQGTFDVSYYDEKVGTCKNNEDRCTVLIPIR